MVSPIDSGPEKSTAPPAKCPPLEELAAFIDGKVAGADRDRMVSHLNECEDCYFIFIETARFSEETAPRDERKGLAAPVLWRLAAAAVLLIGLGLAVSIWLPRGPEPYQVSSIDLVDALASAGELSSLTAAIPTEREQTLGFSGLSPTSRSFRLGVEMIAFGVSLKGTDQEKASESLRRISLLMGEAPDRTAFTSIRERMFLRNVLPEVETLATRRVNAVSYALGKWVEAGRLAATTDRAEFFSSSSFRDGLRVFTRESFPLQVLSELQKIAAATERGAPTDVDLHSLEAAFSQIVLLY